MSRRRIAFRLALVFLAAAGFQALAAEEVGRITYIEGTVSVSRGEEVLADAVGFGFPIENFDEITTGSDGIVTVTLDSATGFGASITMQPDTTFYLDLEKSGTHASGSVELLDGSVGLKVQHLADSALFDVRTAAAVLGVRGTEFDVATVVSGDMLVTVSEGSVECIDTSGQKLFAEPERAVEKIVGGDFRNLPVPKPFSAMSAPGPTASPATLSPLESFRLSWMRDRAAAFRQAAPQIVKAQLARFRRLDEQFNAAYAALAAHRDLISQWLQADREQRPLVRADFAAQRAKIEQSLLSMRAVEYQFERSFHRVSALYRYYIRTARWQDLPDFSFADAFSAFDNERARIQSRLRTARYVAKLFVRREGILPRPAKPPSD